MFTGMPIKRSTVRFFAALFTCLFLAGCNTSNFNEGIGRPAPSQSVGVAQAAPAPIANVETPAIQTSETALVAEPQSPAATQQPVVDNAATQVASLPTGPSIAFLPITGAPQASVTALSRSLKNAASGNNINLVPSGSGHADYRIKGYFSALDDGAGTLLVYVWDVLDSSGNRRHRISGQQRTTAKSSDPWGAVSSTEISRVADDTMARVKAWLTSR